MVARSKLALERMGHAVFPFTREIANTEPKLKEKIRLAANSVYSFDLRRRLEEFILRSKADLIHCHSIWPTLSPSILAVAQNNNIPIVLHCHNQYLTCPVGTHYRQTTDCDDCTNSHHLHCIIRNCRGSYVESMIYGIRSEFHRQNNSFARYVKAITVPSQFMREKLISSGFAAEKIHHLPNWVPSSSNVNSYCPDGPVVYIGRLTEEKGVRMVIRLAEVLPSRQFLIIGSGPLEAELRSCAKSNVTFTGWLENREATLAFARASLAVIPSLVTETFGLTAAEAMSFGVPVIATDAGGLSEIVLNDVTGLLFGKGDFDAFEAAAKRILNDPDRARQMGRLGQIRQRGDYSLRRYQDNLELIHESMAQNV